MSDASAKRAAAWLAAWHRAGLLGTDPEVRAYVADLIQFVGERTMEKTDDGLVVECLKLIQNVDERLRSVADNPTACEATLADGFTHLFARVRQLECQLAGEKKANALLNAGMGDVCEGRDQLKHRVRELEAEVARLREGLRPFADQLPACEGHGDECFLVNATEYTDRHLPLSHEHLRCEHIRRAAELLGDSQ